MRRMKSKLALILALAAFLGLAALGSATAAAPLKTVTESNLPALSAGQVELGGAQSTGSSPSTPGDGNGDAEGTGNGTGNGNGNGNGGTNPGNDSGGGTGTGGGTGDTGGNGNGNGGTGG